MILHYLRNMYNTCVSSEEVLDLTALSSLHVYVLIHAVQSEGRGQRGW